MDEDGWLNGVDSGRMLDPLLLRASPRKLRLYAVACVRRVIIPSHPSDWTAVVDAVERWADGENLDGPTRGRADYQDGACVSLIDADPFHAARATTNQTTLREGESSDTGRLAQCAILRCVFGNPFRPVAVDPSWLAWNDGTLRSMALSIYDDRAWHELPFLADALEDAGCDGEAILSHCRGPGPHVRGCWVVDLLLGKG
jgi:hypothetical protein